MFCGSNMVNLGMTAFGDEVTDKSASMVLFPRWCSCTTVRLLRGRMIDGCRNESTPGTGSGHVSRMLHDRINCMVQMYLAVSVLHTEFICMFLTYDVMTYPEVRCNLEWNLMSEIVDTCSSCNFERTDCRNSESHGAHLLHGNLVDWAGAYCTSYYAVISYL